MRDVQMRRLLLPIKRSDLPPQVALLCHEKVSVPVYPQISFSAVLYNAIQSCLES